MILQLVCKPSLLQVYYRGLQVGNLVDMMHNMPCSVCFSHLLLWKIAFLCYYVAAILSAEIWFYMQLRFWDYVAVKWRDAANADVSPDAFCYKLKCCREWLLSCCTDQLLCLVLICISQHILWCGKFYSGFWSKMLFLIYAEYLSWCFVGKQQGILQPGVLSRLSYKLSFSCLSIRGLS